MHFLFATPAQSLCVKCLLESILQHRRILFEKLFFYKRIELFVAPTPASSPSALAGERPSRNSLSSRVIHQLWFRKKNNIQALKIVGAGEWSFETCNEFPPFPFKILRIHSTKISNCFVALLFFKEKKVVTGHWLIALPIQQSLQVVIISDDVETCFHFNCAQLLSRTVKTYGGEIDFYRIWKAATYCCTCRESLGKWRSTHSVIVLALGQFVILCNHFRRKGPRRDKTSPPKEARHDRPHGHDIPDDVSISQLAAGEKLSRSN